MDEKSLDVARSSRAGRQFLAIPDGFPQQSPKRRLPVPA
jgi:hypothetical protein